MSTQTVTALALPATAQQISRYPRPAGRFGGWWWLESRSSGLVHLRWGNTTNGGPALNPTPDRADQTAACGSVLSAHASHDPSDFKGRLCVRCARRADQWESFYLGEAEL